MRQVFIREKKPIISTREKSPEKTEEPNPHTVRFQLPTTNELNLSFQLLSSLFQM